ncbi:MAG: efflux RND transporter periplasmic adaptor subunit [Acidobacteriota bacterium]|nr:MAG: efflux RND transporter periplasmic adaptor subunit [Acidobacteriota bacterium]
MSRKLIRLLVLVAVIALVAVGIFYATRPRPVSVVVYQVDRGRVESTVANTRAGTVTACRRAKLAPITSGRVVKLPAREGDRVSSGALLIELWNDDFRAELQLAEAEAKASRARAEQACLSAELAEREARRLERLFADEVIGEDRVDKARSERDASQAACQASRAGIEVADARVGVARAALARTVLRAPFDGIVAELNAELGEVVIPSPPGIPTPPAIDLIEEGCLYVAAPLDEVDAPRVRPGLPVRVTMDAFPDDNFPGTVRRIAPYVFDIEKQARTVEIEVMIADPTSIAGLSPGYSADVEVLLDARESVLRVPTEAISDSSSVLVVQGDHLERREVQTGLSNWQLTEIVSGLEAGEKVVLSLDRAGVVAGALAEIEREATR